MPGLIAKILRVLALFGAAGCGAAADDGFVREKPADAALVGEWVPTPVTAALFAEHDVAGSVIALRADRSMELTKVPNWYDSNRLTGNTLTRHGTWDVKWDKDRRRWGVWLTMRPQGGNWFSSGFPVWVAGRSAPEQLVALVGEPEASPPQRVAFVRRPS